MRGRTLDVMAALALAGAAMAPAGSQAPAGSFAEQVEPGADRQAPVDRTVAAPQVADRHWEARWWVLKHTPRRYPRKVPDWSNARYRRAARKLRNKR